MYVQKGLPRWRGFNLLGMFTSQNEGFFVEKDLDLIQELGFDFVRLPMSYRHWTHKGDIEDPDLVYDIQEESLDAIDRCIEAGIERGIHINLNFHRAPGYCINPGEKEPFDLWTDDAARDAFAWHWQMFARRYQGIDSQKLSFDLVNEPPGLDRVSREKHYEVVAAAVAAIREISPDRLIIADGLGAGNIACPELADLNIAQSCRAYVPMTLTHHRASWWRGHENWPDEPVWPDIENYDGVWDRDRLRQHYLEWARMSQELGIGVHCGEGGVYRYTPHHVVLAWFEDVMDILQELNIGYALWNFRGDFGILDSNRTDVDYEDWRGHKLDRRLLDILQQH